MSVLEAAERLRAACAESNRICAEILVTLEQQRLAGEERMRRMTAITNEALASIDAAVANASTLLRRQAS